MSIKHLIKRSLKVVFAKRPIHTTAQITQLGRSELLKDRLALITGGTSGIGYAIADAMLMAGASVIITGRSEQRLDEAKAKLLAVGADRNGRVFTQQMDNSSTDAIKTSFDAIVNKCIGGGMTSRSISAYW